MVTLENNQIVISDEYGEIAYWTIDEWVDSPEVVAHILQCIDIFYSQGPAALRKHVGRELAAVSADYLVEWRIRRYISLLQALRNQGLDATGELYELIRLLRALLGEKGE